MYKKFISATLICLISLTTFVPLGILASEGVPKDELFEFDYELTYEPSKERQEVDPYSEFYNNVALITEDYNSTKISLDEALIEEEKEYLKLQEKVEVIDEVKLEEAFLKKISKNTKSLSMSKVNNLEVLLCAKNPFECNKAKAYSNDAVDYSEKYWMAYTLTDGNGDAYRHALWNALMSRNLTADFTYKMGLAHEGLKPGYDYSAIPDSVTGNRTKMDLHNNRYGRDYGNRVKSTWPSFTTADIAYHMVYHIKNATESTSGIRPRRIYVYSSSLPCNGKGEVQYVDYCVRYVGWYQNTSSGGLR